MSNVPSDKGISTWEALTELGFKEGNRSIFGSTPALTFNFGEFELSAVSIMNANFANVIAFSAMLETKREISDISFELPQIVESKQQCAAWLTWGLDKNFSSARFKPLNEPDWLQSGRLDNSLLPWVRERALQEEKEKAFRNRPLCRVQREWLKLGLKKLADSMALKAGKGSVTVFYDGQNLSFGLDGRVFFLPAEGRPWESKITVPILALAELPKRLISEPVEVSVWDGRFQIDQRWYSGAVILSSH